MEVKGWNQFGGWRIGIRDNHNSYHYYAHLGSYHKEIEVGTIVKPGTVLGYVGSSGYGKKVHLANSLHIFIMVFINLMEEPNGLLTLILPFYSGSARRKVKNNRESFTYGT